MASLRLKLAHAMRDGDVARARAVLESPGLDLGRGKAAGYFVELALSARNVEMISCFIRNSYGCAEYAEEKMHQAVEGCFDEDQVSQRVGILRMLLAAGADVHSKRTEIKLGLPTTNQISLLCSAARQIRHIRGNRRTLVLLLRYGADITSVDMSSPQDFYDRIVPLVSAYLLRVQAAGGFQAYERARQRKLHDILAIYFRARRLPDAVLWHVVRLSPAAAS